MKLYYGAGSCAMGIHLLLEEIGRPYESQRIDLRAGEQQSPAFLAINPKGKVPVLQREDGSVLTEYPVIAQYLAKAFPAAGLLPQTESEELDAAMATDFCVATIHMQGFARLFRPSNFSPDEATHDQVKARGTELIGKGFAILDAALASKPYVARTYSYGDSALFYVEYWAAKRVGMALPPNLAQHFERMMERPSTRRMLEQEGLSA